MMKVLMVAPEVAPFVKVGGLGDVVGALPKYLQAMGHDVRVICPLYGSVRRQADWKADERPFFVHLGSGIHYARIWHAGLPGSSVPLYFLEYDRYFGREGVYAGPSGDYTDNGERFAFLCRAAVDLCKHLGWIPDIFHCHDWTTGLVPVYLNTSERSTAAGLSATVMTIHNLQFQGIFHPELLNFAGLPWSVFKVDGMECMGYANLLKGGIYHTTKITTVSPTYAAEIQGPERGEGLNHVLRFRAGDLVGIVNGIDEDEWDPRRDRRIPECYDSDSVVEGKLACKVALQRELGLRAETGVPLFVVVSRLYPQKGLDLLAAILNRLVADMEIQVAVLGSGDAGLEATFSEVAVRHPGTIAFRVGYREELAHQFYAGGDFFVMPSRFEPCGLSQMYAMRYGTPPVVRSTGGLVDTVEQYVEGRSTGTGFRFEEASESALYYAIGWACSTYYDRPAELLELRRNGMGKDFSWRESARKYSDTYSWAAAAREWVRMTTV